MKKVMITVIATWVSVFSFAQVNLGLQTTTQAAVNATAATTAATKATTVATQVTSSTVNAGLNRTAEVKTAMSSTVNAGSKQALATTGKIKNDAAVNAGTAVSSSSQAQTNSNSNNASLIANGDLNTGANATINGGKIIDKTEGAAVATTKATTETVKAVKGQASSEIKSDVKAVKQTASSVKPAVNTQASAEAKTATHASVNNK